MIAGKDSTTNTLSLFIYMLCRNPLIEEKIVHEVREVLFGSDTVNDIENLVDRATDEALDKMHYLHAALTETLRLYPGLPVVPAFILGCDPDIDFNRDVEAKSLRQIS